MKEHKLEQLAFERLNKFLNSRKIQIKWNSDSNVFALIDLNGERESYCCSGIGWRSIKDLFFHGDYSMEKPSIYTTHTFFEVCDICFNVVPSDLNFFNYLDKYSKLLAEMSRKFQPIKSYSSYEELLIKMDLAGI